MLVWLDPWAITAGSDTVEVARAPLNENDDSATARIPVLRAVMLGLQCKGGSPSRSWQAKSIAGLIGEPYESFFAKLMVARLRIARSPRANAV